MMRFILPLCPNTISLHGILAARLPQLAPAARVTGLDGDGKINSPCYVNEAGKKGEGYDKQLHGCVTLWLFSERQTHILHN